MKTLLILNLITNWTILIIMLVRPFWNRIEFRYEERFGKKRPELWVWNENHTVGKRLFNKLYA